MSFSASLTVRECLVLLAVVAIVFAGRAVDKHREKQEFRAALKAAAQQIDARGERCI